jgi:hypothetical protein
MKKFVFLSLLITAFLALFAVSNAQEDVLRPKGKKSSTIKNADESRPRHTKVTLGFEPGLNINFFSQDVSWVHNLSNSPLSNTAWDGTKSGTGLSPFLAFLVDFPLSDSWGLQVKLTTDYKSFSNDKTGTLTDGNPLDAAYLQVFNGEYSYNANLLSENVSLLLRYNFTSRWFGLFGVCAMFPLSDIDYHWTQKHTEGNITYTDWNDIDVKWTQKTRVGLEAGVGVKIPLSNKIWLVPQARLQIVPTPVIDDHVGYVINSNDLILYTVSYSNIVVHSIQLGLGFWFDLGN